MKTVSKIMTFRGLKLPKQTFDSGILELGVDANIERESE